jgi:hypothetical protein
MMIAVVNNERLYKVPNLMAWKHYQSLWFAQGRQVTAFFSTRESYEAWRRRAEWRVGPICVGRVSRRPL